MILKGKNLLSKLISKNLEMHSMFNVETNNCRKITCFLDWTYSRCFFETNEDLQDIILVIDCNTYLEQKMENDLKNC